MERTLQYAYGLSDKISLSRELSCLIKIKRLQCCVALPAIQANRTMSVLIVMTSATSYAYLLCYLLRRRENINLESNDPWLSQLRWLNQDESDMKSESSFSSEPRTIKYLFFCNGGPDRQPHRKSQLPAADSRGRTTLIKPIQELPFPVYRGETSIVRKLNLVGMVSSC